MYHFLFHTRNHFYFTLLKMFKIKPICVFVSSAAIAPTKTHYWSSLHLQCCIRTHNFHGSSLCSTVWKVPVKLRAMLLEATAYNSLVAVEKVGHGHTEA